MTDLFFCVCLSYAKFSPANGKVCVCCVYSKFFTLNAMYFYVAHSGVCSCNWQGLFGALHIRWVLGPWAKRVPELCRVSPGQTVRGPLWARMVRCWAEPHEGVSTMSQRVSKLLLRRGSLPIVIHIFIFSVISVSYIMWFPKEKTETLACSRITVKTLWKVQVDEKQWARLLIQRIVVQCHRVLLIRTINQLALFPPLISLPYITLSCLTDVAFPHCIYLIVYLVYLTIHFVTLPCCTLP